MKNHIIEIGDTVYAPKYPNELFRVDWIENEIALCKNIQSYNVQRPIIYSNENGIVTFCGREIELNDLVKN